MAVARFLPLPLMAGAAALGSTAPEASESRETARVFSCAHSSLSIACIRMLQHDSL